MQMTHKIWMNMTAIVLGLIVVVAGIQVWNQSRQSVAVMALLDTRCDLKNGPCAAEFPGGGRIVFSMAPMPIEGLKPLQLKVQTEGLDVNTVEVNFRGLGMNMGFNRPKLKQETENQYSGSGMLSACIVENMTWEAMVLLDTDDGVLGAPFHFETE